MSGIDDLKTNQNYTGTGTASGTPDGNILILDNPNIKRKVKNRPTVAPEGTIDLGSVNKTQDDDFTPPKRTIADLSSLPKREIQGVDIKTSIEDEIFKPGGDFDIAKEKKIQEYHEVMDLIDQHNAQVAANLGIDVPSDEELREIGQEDMTPAIIGTKYYDQSDGFGRARKAITTSPLEEKAAKEGKTIDQLVSGQDAPTPKEVTLADGTVVKPTTNDDDPDQIKNLNFEEEEEEMDELEREINEEFTSNEEVNLVDVTTPVAEEPATDELLPIDETEDDLQVLDPVPEEPEDIINEEVPVVEEIKEPVSEPDPAPVVKEETPVVEVKSPKKMDKEKVPTASDLIFDAAKNPNIGMDTNLTIDEEDMADIEEGSDSVEVNDVDVIGEEENVKQVQAAISEKIKPVVTGLNVQSMKVVNKPISLSAAVMESQRAAMSWVLPNSGQYIAMREFTGKEIEQLGDNSGTNRFETMKNRYKLFYDHIVSPKPATFE